MAKLFEELKRRKVVRVAGVYAVVAWLLIQVANNLVPALQLPDWTNSFIVLLLLIGFPIALVAEAKLVLTDELVREALRSAKQSVGDGTAGNDEAETTAVVAATPGDLEARKQRRKKDKKPARGRAAVPANDTSKD